MKIDKMPDGLKPSELFLVGPELLDKTAAETVYSGDFVRETDGGIVRCVMSEASYIVVSQGATESGGEVKVCKMSDADSRLASELKD